MLLKGFQRCDTYLPMYEEHDFEYLSILVALAGVAPRVRRAHIQTTQLSRQYMYIFISLVTSFGILEGTGNCLRTDYKSL